MHSCHPSVAERHTEATCQQDSLTQELHSSLLHARDVRLFVDAMWLAHEPPHATQTNDAWCKRTVEVRDEWTFLSNTVKCWLALAPPDEVEKHEKKIACMHAL